jgi:hypothetical protein
VRTISRKVFEDKVRGGWAGQMIGVSFGASTEFKSNGKIIEGIGLLYEHHAEDARRARRVAAGVLAGSRARVERAIEVGRSVVPPDTTDNALWHTYGLPNTKHTVRIVTRADKAQNSKGTVVTLTGAVAYRPR